MKTPQGPRYLSSKLRLTSGRSPLSSGGSTPCENPEISGGCTDPLTGNSETYIKGTPVNIDIPNKICLEQFGPILIQIIVSVVFAPQLKNQHNALGQVSPPSCIPGRRTPSAIALHVLREHQRNGFFRARYATRVHTILPYFAHTLQTTLQTGNRSDPWSCRNGRTGRFLCKIALSLRSPRAHMIAL